MERRPPRPRAWYALLPSAIFLAPVLAFLLDNDYGLGAPESLAWIAGTVAAGGAVGLLALRSPGLLRAALLSLCLVLFVDVQLAPVGRGTLALAFAAFTLVVWVLRENAFPILSAGFATLLLSISLVPTRTPLRASSGTAVGARPVRGELPPMIVLFLDEHVGLEGIPLEIEGGPEAREALSDLFVTHGFRLYSRAFSQYSSTTDSIPNVLNHSARRTRDEWVREVRGRFSLRESLFLKRAASSGYAIRIYQSDYLDLCDVTGVRPEACLTYRSAHLGSIRGQDLTWSERAAVIGSSLLARSLLLEGSKRFRVWLRSLGAPIRQPGDEPRTLVGPFESMTVLDRIEEDVTRGARGRLFLAHLLIPHFPHVYEADCRVAPRDLTPLWLKVKNRPPSPASVPEVPEGLPRDRYRRYLSQVRCLSARLTSFFDSLERAGALENSVVVVLGDHGPRIGLRRPSPGNLGSVKTADFVDGFSTLFAARGPGIEPGLDPEPRSIARAFAEAVGFPGPPPETDDLLLPHEGQPILVPVPMPSF